MPAEDPVLEVIEEGECYRIAREAGFGPAVPYGSILRTNDSSNYGFIDLRGNLAAVELIPEARDCPGLQEFLRTINAPSSPLMSLGCDHRLEKLSDTWEGGPKSCQHSYVDIAYVNPERGHLEQNLIDLARWIVAKMALQPSNWIQLHLVPQRMRHFFGDTDCFNLAIWIAANGYDDNHATEQLNLTYQRLASFITKTGA